MLLRTHDHGLPFVSRQMLGVVRIQQNHLFENFGPEHFAHAFQIEIGSQIRPLCCIQRLCFTQLKTNSGRRAEAASERHGLTGCVKRRPFAGTALPWLPAPVDHQQWAAVQWPEKAKYVNTGMIISNLVIEQNVAFRVKHPAAIDASVHGRRFVIEAGNVKRGGILPLPSKIFLFLGAVELPECETQAGEHNNQRHQVRQAEANQANGGKFRHGHALYCSPVKNESPALLSKFLVIFVFLGILYTLASSFYFLITDDADSDRTVRRLSWRVGLSVGLILVLWAGFHLGIIEPQGVNPVQYPAPESD